jgi:hypothetical protein
MSTSAAIADSLLRQASMRLWGMLAGGLAARSVNVLFQVRFPPSRLHAPVSQRASTISRRSVMNYAR